MSTHRFGTIVVAGRPNVGKSTLVNQLVGQKVSIISRRPQTTRHRIMGIVTHPDAQYALVDTPGIHDDAGAYANRVFNRAALSSLEDVDFALFLVTSDGWRDDDDRPLAALKAAGVPIILVVNKVDRLKGRDTLLPLLQTMAAKVDAIEYIPLSALKGRNVDLLEQAILKHLPEGPPGYPEDEITDRSMRFQAAELVREQLFNQLGQELPYQTAVEVEDYQQDDQGIRVHVVIWVEKDSQKPIVLGNGGKRIKSIGTRARAELIEMSGGERVYLKTWVKVRGGWADDERSLRALGYIEQ
ncbi:GTPase Era [Gammaproteobacteria bacterium]|nr:GTPase Era [Gammaproteobacteria bacterium]